MVMIFYQSHWFCEGVHDFGELRRSSVEAMKDLKSMGYEIVGLRGRGERNAFPLFDPNRNIGIAIIKV
jgi:hypothetical protein